MNPAGAFHLIGRSRVLRMLTDVIEKRASSPLIFWLLAAVLLTIAGHPALWRHPFVYPHAWTSAHFATLARSFAEHGVVALGGVPIQNNAPLGIDPDASLHWPPLFPIVLSLGFQLFGEAEAVAHGLMLAVLMANAVVLYALVKACAGREAGLFAAFAFLVLPVTAKYGHLVIPEHPAILGTLLALLAFIKATGEAPLSRVWATFGAMSLMFATWTAWEPLLASPGVLIAAMWNRSRAQVRLALFYLCAGAGAFVIVIGIYVLQRPDLWTDLWRTIVFRTGVSDFQPTRSHVHTIVNDALYSRFSMPSWRIVLHTLVSRLELIGQAGTVAIGTTLVIAWVRRGKSDDRGSARLMFGGLLAMWGLWFALMLNHAYIHDMIMLLAAPAAAAALGLCGKLLIDLSDGAREASTRRAVRWGALVVLPAVLLLTLPITIVERFLGVKRGDPDVSFARAINEATDPGAVIMVRTPSMVPLYYSKRHLLRGVLGDHVVDSVENRMSEEFPGAQAYLALRPLRDIEDFPNALQRLRLVKQSRDLILLAVGERNPGSAAARTPVSSAPPPGAR